MVLKMRRNWSLDEAQQAAAEAQAAVAEMEAEQFRQQRRAAGEALRQKNLVAEERRVRQAANNTLVAAGEQLALLVAGLRHADEGTRDEFLALVATLVAAAVPEGT